MGKAAAQQLGEYRTAMGDLRQAVEARRADPTDRQLLKHLVEARARVRRVQPATARV